MKSTSVSLSKTAFLWFLMANVYHKDIDKSTPGLFNGGMKITFMDKEGRFLKRNVSRRRIIAACFKELLLSHDHLYRSVFKGTVAKPHWDIAAKNARRVYESLLKNKEIPLLTIEDKFLPPA